MSAQHKGTLLVLASAAGFATLAIFIKVAYLAGANSVTILTMRFMLAAFLLWPILKLRNISVHIDAKTRLRLCLLGALGYGTMSACFAVSIEYVPVPLAALLLYTYPALVTLLSFAIGDEQITWYKSLALTICFTGLVLILGVSSGGVNPIGIMLGLSAAVLYSGYIVIGNRLLKNIHPLVATMYVCSAAGAAFTAIGLFQGSLILALPPLGWLALAGIAVLGTIVGILFFFAGLSLIGAANASIISTTEPLITVLLSVALLGDSISLLQALGGMLIIASVIILQLRSRPAIAHSNDFR